MDMATDHKGLLKAVFYYANEAEDMASRRLMGNIEEKEVTIIRDDREGTDNIPTIVEGKTKAFCAGPPQRTSARTTRRSRYSKHKWRAHDDRLASSEYAPRRSTSTAGRPGPRRR